MVRVLVGQVYEPPRRFVEALEDEDEEEWEVKG